MIKTFLDGRIVVKVGDITDERSDAIVNAANSTLLGGGGVDGAIHSRGGSEILEECRRIRATVYRDGLPAGEAVVTTGGKLHAKYVIHTVGPVYGKHGNSEAELLASAYLNSLARAHELGLQSISFPSISTGAFHYPKDEAAKISSRAMKRFLKDHQIPKQVFLVFINRSDAEVFLKHQVFDS